MPMRERLTPREREVAKLVAAGLTNKQIANMLIIELCTVQTHLHRILRKLGLERRGQLIATWARGEDQ